MFFNKFRLNILIWEILNHFNPYIFLVFLSTKACSGKVVEKYNNIYLYGIKWTDVPNENKLFYAFMYVKLLKPKNLGI